VTDDKQVQRGSYYYWVRLPTRWMDNDIYGHVNNVNYYSFFDTAVNDYLVKVGGLDIHNDDAVGFVVASECQYKKPIAHPDQLDIGLKVLRLGRSSVQYEVAIFREADDSAAAYGTFTHVFVSRKSNSSVAIPSHIRLKLEMLVDAHA